MALPIKISDTFAFIKPARQRVNNPEEKAIQTTFNVPLSVACISVTGTRRRLATSQAVSKRLVTPIVCPVKIKTCLSLEKEEGTLYRRKSVLSVPQEVYLQSNSDPLKLLIHPDQNTLHNVLDAEKLALVQPLGGA